MQTHTGVRTCVRDVRIGAKVVEQRKKLQARGNWRSDASLAIGYTSLGGATRRNPTPKRTRHWATERGKNTVWNS